MVCPSLVKDSLIFFNSNMWPPSLMIMICLNIRDGIYEYDISDNILDGTGHDLSVA